VTTKSLAVAAMTISVLPRTRMRCLRKNNGTSETQKCGDCNKASGTGRQVYGA
jgi:hypothetical protein